ncbi:MAG: serine hydrolase [Candidatus Cyclobacteriaceae bacterium M2_1C_046]
MRILLILFAFFISFNNAVGQNKKKNDFLNEFIEQGMSLWNVPGLAVTVVKDDQVVFQKTYGVKDIETNELVNSQTMFANASTTKAFVALGIAILVDGGKLDWQDRVIDHLPYFRLSDPYVTQEARIVDLLTHNIGLGNADLLWIIDSLSAKETVAQMAMADLTYSMRSSFIYQNIMYAAAGEVIESVTGKPWNEFLQKEVWQPLGMDRTVGLVKDLEGKDNYVAPHYEFDEKGVEKISYMVSDPIGAAGMMWSSIEDMSKWLTFLLDSTKIDGERLLSEESYSKLFQPHAIIPENQFYPTTQLTQPNWTTYGLGWFQHDYRGKMVNFHTGSLAGLVAIAGLLPEEDLGVFVFANLDHAELRHAIMYEVFDLYALGGERSWNKEIYQLYNDMKQQATERSEESDERQVVNTSPSLKLEDYAGKYLHKLYGKVEVRHEDDKLQLQLNNKDMLRLDHYHFNTFESDAEKYWLDEMKVDFDLNEQGKVESLSFSGVEFKRISE